MKLYFSPGACSLSPHIVLREAGLPFEAIKVDLATKKTADGGSLADVNPKGQVPTLVTEKGEVLTEGPAIVQYIADRASAAHLAPPNGTFERTRLQEWLNFITSELHKGFSPLFNKQIPDEVKAMFRANLVKKIGLLEERLAAQPYLMGQDFSVADAYAFTVLNWTKWTGIDLSPFPAVQAFQERVAARPKVREALKAEGLVPA